MIAQNSIKTRNCLLCFLISVFCILSFFGCQEKTKTAKPSKALVGTKQEQTEVSLKRENENLKAENQHLQEQIATLIGLNKNERLNAIATLSSIELTGRCGIYEKKSDSNNSQWKKMLMVYLRPIDDMGDCIKAPGAVKVELWDLNARPDKALLQVWQVKPEELKKEWSGSLLTSYYKLPFDVSSILTGKEKEFTLKVQFTDYLTGKVFNAQQVIKLSKD